MIQRKLLQPRKAFGTHKLSQNKVIQFIVPAFFIAMTISIVLFIFANWKGIIERSKKEKKQSRRYLIFWSGIHIEGIVFYACKTWSDHQTLRRSRDIPVVSRQYVFAYEP